MNDLPLITIGIPTYNRPAGLQKVLDSVLNQSYTNLEIIVSDNNSKDDKVWGILTSYAKIDKRLIIFRQNENVGLANNFQFVLNNAQGEYFTWISDDDNVDSNYIEILYNKIAGLKDYNLVVPKIAAYNANGEFQGFNESIISIDNDSPNDRVYAYFKQLSAVGYFYGLYRTSVLMQVGYDNRMIGGDILTSIFLSFSGKIAIAENTAYKYVAGGSSTDIERLARNVGLSQAHAIFFGFWDAWIVLKTILQYPLFKRMNIVKRYTFSLRAAALMIIYTKAFMIMFLIIKRKLLRFILNRQTLRPVAS